MEALNIYKDNKLLVRAMDGPHLQKGVGCYEYDCTVWANEFELLRTTGLNSASSTLLIPGVGVRTYKSIGFLINSDLANCFHISDADSCSNGSMANGTFRASDTDYHTLDELAKDIIDNKETTMNEINIITTIDSVVGLVVNKCTNIKILLSKILIVQKALKHMLDIEYPIYVYDTKEGTLEPFEMTKEIEEELIPLLKTTNISYWPDTYEEPVTANITDIKVKTL